jgi:hypothetical protein
MSIKDEKVEEINEEEKEIKEEIEPTKQEPDWAKEEKQNFFQKLKNDKKFRAKGELIIYGVIIIAIIIFAQFSSNSTSYDYTNTVTNTDNDTSNNQEEETTNLYDTLTDNYKASVEVITLKEGKASSRKYEINKTTVDDNSQETITKVNTDDTSNEYQVGDTGEFYSTQDGNITMVEENDIFDIVSYKYLELNNIKKYISKGITDYTTNYSNGTQIVSYKVMIKDILLDNTTDEYITINVTNESDKVTIDIDYTNLLKSDTIDTCNVKIIYTNTTSENQE